MGLTEYVTEQNVTVSEELGLIPATKQLTVKVYLRGVRGEWCEKATLSRDGAKVYLHMTEAAPMTAVDQEEDRVVEAQMPEGYVGRSVVNRSYNERLARVRFVLCLEKAPA